MGSRNSQCLNVLGVLIASTVALATPVTVATCSVSASVTGTLLNQTDDRSCFGSAGSPLQPEVPGYTVSAQISGDLMRGSGQTTATGGFWATTSDLVTSIATGLMTDQDSVLFNAGEGFGTLRLNVGYSQSIPGAGGSVSFAMDGGPLQVLNAGSVLSRTAILDFTIPLSAVFNFATQMSFRGSSSAHDGGHSGIHFDVTKLRLYGADGAQMTALGVGASGRQYSAIYDPSDTALGPVLAAHSPEPGTFALLCISGLAVLFSFGYQKGWRPVKAWTQKRSAR